MAQLEAAKKQMEAGGMIDGDSEQSISFAALMAEAEAKAGTAEDAKVASFSRPDGTTAQFDLSLIEDEDFKIEKVEQDRELYAGVRSSEVEVLFEDDGALAGKFNRLTSNTIIYGTPLPYRVIAYEGWNRAEHETELRLRHNQKINLRIINVPVNNDVSDFAHEQLEAVMKFVSSSCRWMVASGFAITTTMARSSSRFTATVASVAALPWSLPCRIK